MKHTQRFPTSFRKVSVNGVLTSPTKNVELFERHDDLLERLDVLLPYG